MPLITAAAVWSAACTVQAHVVGIPTAVATNLCPALMRRCSHDRCIESEGFAVKGTIGAYCKQHADHSMVNIESTLCSYDLCKKQPSFNVESSKTPVYCKLHAEDGMVNVRQKRCSYTICIKQSSFNVEGRKTALDCKQHAGGEMVNVLTRRCSRDTCMKRLSFNAEGSKTPVYCKLHAAGEMVDVVNRRCARDTCMKIPSFNVEGSTTAMYCKQHAADDMVDIISRPCSHDTCTRKPIWGVLTGGMATGCSEHKGDMLVGQLISFSLECKVVNCRRTSRWGLSGKQPTHCHQHGPSQDGFVCVGKTPASKRARRSLSDCATSRPAFHVKTECTV